MIRFALFASGALAAFAVAATIDAASADGQNVAKGTK